MPGPGLARLFWLGAPLKGEGQPATLEPATWGFTEVRGPVMGVPIKRVTVLWDYIMGLPFLLK